MKSQHKTDWVVVIGVAAIGMLAVTWWQQRPRKVYEGMTNTMIIASNAPMQKVGAGEIPFRLHSTVRANIRADVINNELVVRIPLSPDMERKGIKVSVEHQTNQ